MLVALLGSLSVCFPSVALDRPGLDEEVEGIVARGDVPGLSVAVAKDGRTLWERGAGWADVDNKVRATEQTPFFIASVTKSITATAVLQLEKRGKLHLDTAVNDYLGGNKLHSPVWNVKQATVRRLLSHTSGLTTFARWCGPGESGCDVEEEIRHYGIVVWPPGEVFDYSNLGYGILGHVIERISGQSLDPYLRTALFVPLQMQHCGVNLSKSLKALAARQYDERTHRRLSPKISGHPGATGLYCSAHDLLLFGMFHLTDLTLDEMHQPQSNTRGQYGLGWWIKKQGPHQVIFAQGGTSGSYALLTLIPSEHLAVVVLANSYSKSVSELGDRIISRLLPGFASTADTPQKPAPKDAADLSWLSGKWSGHILTLNGTVSASLEIGRDGSARGQIGSQPPEPMASVSVKPRHFYGQLAGDPSIPDAPPASYRMELDLALHGDDLLGAATSRPPPGEDGNQLPHWIKLSRVH
jgi:CubicO group peptidase (beta-lactamase class C family)